MLSGLLLFSVYSDYAFCLYKMKNEMTETYSKKLTDYLTPQIQADNPHKKEQSHNVNHSLWASGF